MRPSIFFSALLISLNASAGDPVSHCKQAEQFFFSCELIETKKLVSLCGNTASANQGAWLQYRYGKPGKPEIVMPKAKETSLPQFSNYVETANAINLKISEIWLSAGAYSYMIASATGGDRGNDTDQEEHHLVVYRGSKQLLSSSRCKLPVIYRLDEIQNFLLPTSAKRLG